MFRFSTMMSAAIVSVAAVASASAAPVILNFNSISARTSPQNNAVVQAYLNSVLGAGAVTVHGAVADQTYNGDGFVNKDSYNIRETLGTSNFVNGVLVPNSTHSSSLVYDTFLYNVGGEGRTRYGQSGNDKITFDFQTAINSISFDWEVFPDGSCPHLNTPGHTTCGSNNANKPDFELWAGTATHQTVDKYSGDANNDFPVTGNNLPQGIGYFSMTFSSPVTHLEFVDWPARIGVDNLDPSRVPEPATLALLALGILGIAATRKTKRS